jgi:glycosyltransferase involved in cell wall biosynthesis
MLRIIVPLYNVEKYVEKMIMSVISQQCQEYKCYIFDDLSTDNSIPILKDIIKNDNRFEIITNKEKYYPVGNHYQAIQRKDIYNDDILICLDGDDWFADKYVLDRIKSYYSNPDIFATLGQFKIYNGYSYSLGFTTAPNWNVDVRKQPWTFSHLKTFKAVIGRKIKKEDLICPLTNTFWNFAGDLALVFPILEMCGEKRTLFVQDINYIYNTENNLNEAKVNINMVIQYDILIRQKQKYNLL